LGAGCLWGFGRISGSVKHRQRAKKVGFGAYTYVLFDGLWELDVSSLKLMDERTIDDRPTRTNQELKSPQHPALVSRNAVR
jgi:hypothetical protein